MLQQIGFGSVLMILTTAIHAGSTAWVIRLLRRTHAGRWSVRSAGVRASLVSGVVLLLFLIALLQSGLWAAVYVAVGALADFESALYFSIVTFTTLGYGDITLGTDWRLLASFQAANGTIMFGWSTALVMALLHRMASELADARA